MVGKAQISHLWVPRPAVDDILRRSADAFDLHRQALCVLGRIDLRQLLPALWAGCCEHHCQPRQRKHDCGNSVACSSAVHTVHHSDLRV